MPFGYIGQNQTKQKVKNSGVLSSFEISHLEKQGHSSGSLEFIAEDTASSVSLLDFTSIKQDQYDIHFVTYHGISGFSGSGANFSLRFFESGTLESSNVYDYAACEQKADGNKYTPQSSTGNALYLSMASLAPGEVTSGYVYIYNAGNSSKYTFINVHDLTEDNSVMAFNYGGGCLPQASTVDGFRFLSPGGQTFNGNVKIFGVKKLWVL